jgi:hypothetical protein
MPVCPLNAREKENHLHGNLTFAYGISSPAGSAPMRVEGRCILRVLSAGDDCPVDDICGLYGTIQRAAKALLREWSGAWPA